MDRYLCIGPKTKMCSNAESHKIGQFCNVCQMAYWTDQPEIDKKDCTGLKENSVRKEKTMADAVHKADDEYKKSVNRGIITYIQRR